MPARPQRATDEVHELRARPNQTVALLLGIAPGTVAMRCLRALQRLREHLPRPVLDELM